MTATATPPAAALRSPRHVPPIVHAGRMLLEDLLSTFVFLALYALTKDLRVATVLAVAVGAGRILWQRWRGQTVEVIEWVSLAIVAVLGAAALLTHDARFVMLKPTLVYVAIGAAMLKRGWMLRYLPPQAGGLVDDVATRFGYVWATLMFATAAINLALAAGGDARAWALFVAVFPIASKLGLFGVQYLITRALVIARRRRPSHVVNARQP